MKQALWVVSVEKKNSTRPYQHQKVDKAERNNDGGKDGRGGEDDDQGHQDGRDGH